MILGQIHKGKLRKPEAIFLSPKYVERCIKLTDELFYGFDFTHA